MTPQYKKFLQRIAWAEAAQIVANAMDHVDLPSDLSTRDEDYVREYIRNEITGIMLMNVRLMKLAGPQ